MKSVKKQTRQPIGEESYIPLYVLGFTEKLNSDFYPEYLILSNAVEAADNFNQMYTWTRSGALGRSTQWQQDLCRAMFVFACAGLDVFVKKLIESKLSLLLARDAGVKGQFEKFILRSGKDWSSVLALALASEDPKKAILDEWIKSFTGESLQSTKQLYTVANAFGLDSASLIGAREEELNEAFKIRNEIIHEMDINTKPPKQPSTAHRTRTVRSHPTLSGHTILVLNLAEEFFKSCKAKLA